MERYQEILAGIVADARRGTPERRSHNDRRSRDPEQQDRRYTVPSNPLAEQLERERQAVEAHDPRFNAIRNRNRSDGDR